MERCASWTCTSSFLKCFHTAATKLEHSICFIVTYKSHGPGRAKLEPSHSWWLWPLELSRPKLPQAKPKPQLWGQARLEQPYLPNKCWVPSAKGPKILVMAAVKLCIWLRVSVMDSPICLCRHTPTCLCPLPNTYINIPQHAYAHCPIPICWRPRFRVQGMQFGVSEEWGLEQKSMRGMSELHN